MSIYNSISEFVGNVSSRNAKIENLTALLESEKYLYEAFELALNPLITFGFESVNMPNCKGASEFDQQAIDDLKYLSRTNRSNHTVEFLRNMLRRYNDETRQLIKNIILKDLRCGVQLSSFNKAVDLYNKKHEIKLNKINDYPCMLVSAYSEKIFNKLFKNEDSYAYCQLKCDGMRFNAVVDGQSVKFFGRSGKQIYITDSQFIDQFIRLANGCNVVYDGELLIDGDSSGHAADRKIGNGILNKAVKDTISDEEQKRIVAVIWDRIPYDDFSNGICNDTYLHRHNTLLEDFEYTQPSRIFKVPTRIVHNQQQCDEMFNQMLSERLEGVIVKSPFNVWKDVRATDCVKLKAELDADLRVIAVEKASGKYEGMLGALVCETDDHNVQVKVGTGFTDQQRQELITQDLVGKIVTVVYNARIQDKTRPDVDSLFLPRFIEFREDKSVTNTSEEVK